MISVVIPTFNNAKDIAQTIENVHAAMQEKYEIIIVDDHSSDDTWERAMELGANRPIRVICWKTRRGSAHALYRGIRDAKGDVMVVLLDLHISTASIKEMVSSVRLGCDVYGFIVREPKNVFEKMASALARVPYAWSPAFAFSSRTIDNVFLFKRFPHRLLEILVKSDVKSKKTVVLSGRVPKRYRRTLIHSLLLLMPWVADVFLHELK